MPAESVRTATELTHGELSWSVEVLVVNVTAETLSSPLATELRSWARVLSVTVPLPSASGSSETRYTRRALSALEEGYEVFVVADASGTFNQTTREAAWSRMEAAGAQLMTWFGVACELHRDWRNDVEGLATLFSNHLPSYRCLINSYNAGKAAASK